MAHHHNTTPLEVIEQLPLELHRSFALLRELEMQMRTHAVTIRDESIFYRDWRTQRAAKLQEKWQLAENRSIQEQTHQEKFMPLIQPQKSSPNPNDYVHLHAPRLPPCQFRLCRQIFRNAEGAPRNEIIEESEVGAVVGGEPQGAPSGRTNHVATAAALSGPQRAPYRKDKASVEPRKTTYIRHASLSRISRAINNSMAAAEEKVGLALAVYQLIDRQCRRLDTDLAKMTGTVAVAVAAAMSEDAALLSPAAAGVAKESAGSPSQQGQSQGNQECLDSMGEAGLYGASLHLGARERARSRRHGGMGGTGKVFIAKEAEDAASKKQGKRTRRFAGPDVAGAGAQEGLQENGAAGTVDSGGILADMAYDPSEPVYCYCRQPSFGFMVGCDNDECAREWYHLSCLESRGELTPSVMQSLEDERKKWFCKDCHAASKGAGDDEGRKTLTRKRSKKRSH